MHNDEILNELIKTDNDLQILDSAYKSLIQMVVDLNGKISDETLNAIKYLENELNRDFKSLINRKAKEHAETIKAANN